MRVHIKTVLIVITSLTGLAKSNTFCSNGQIGAPSIAEGPWHYFCFHSIDYIEDLKSARADIVASTFHYSNIPILKDDSFARFNETLATIDLYKAGLRDIEDNAFRNMREVNTLIIMGNNLEVAKAAWFRDLKKLSILYLGFNRIKTIEGNFFSNVGYLQLLAISGNELTCLPNAEFESFHAREIAINHNPWSEQCFAWIRTVVPQGNISTSDATDIGTGPGGLNDDLIPDAEVHSIEDLCTFIRSHPSPTIQC